MKETLCCCLSKINLMKSARPTSAVFLPVATVDIFFKSSKTNVDSLLKCKKCSLLKTMLLYLHWSILLFVCVCRTNVCVCFRSYLLGSEYSKIIRIIVLLLLFIPWNVRLSIFCFSVWLFFICSFVQRCHQRAHSDTRYL